MSDEGDGHPAELPAPERADETETLPAAPDPAQAPTLLEAPAPDERPTLLTPPGPLAANAPPAWQEDPALARTVGAWDATLLANPGVEDPGLTLKAPPTPPTSTQPTLSPTVRIAYDPGEGAAAPPERFDYLVAERLGAGGMGEVYAARHQVLRRRIALKTIRPDLAARPDVEGQFVAEALVTGQLEHPNIVPVYDLGRTEDQRLYMGMKLVRGESLDALLEREPATNPARLRRYLEVLSRVCDALAYAHSAGVIHRDLKPSNVMVGEFGEVQVMDWGLALAVGETSEVDANRESSGAAGTPAYMAPEQANNEVGELSPASDVYLLGAMLYEVLTGTPPHRGDTVLNVLVAAIRGEIEPPRARAPRRAIPRDLEELCLRALTRDPRGRLSSAQELKAGIARHLAHSEALGMLERARATLAPHREREATGTLHERAEAFTRVRLRLEQALELWPESREARELLRETQLLQADLALDRGDPREALALVEAIDAESAGAGPRLKELRAAARRQRGRRRNQALTAAVLGLGLLFGSAWWTTLVQPDQAELEARAQARAELPRVTEAAWQALRRQAKPRALDQALEAVRRGAEAAGWGEAPGDSDRETLGLAATWEALRQGDRGLAAARLRPLLPEEARARFLALWEGEASPGPADELCAAWREAAGELSPALRNAGEAVLLLAAAAQRPGLAEDPAAQTRWRERLAACGARAVLVELRSGAPAWMLHAGPEAAARPRVRRGRAWVQTRYGRRRQPFLSGVDPRDGRELWRFPPDPWREDADDSLGAPLLVRDGAEDLLCLSWAGEVLGLDPADGRVRRRLRAFDRIGALLPAGPAAMLLVQSTGNGLVGRGRSRRIPCTPRGWSAARPAAGDDFALLFQAKRGLGKLFQDPADQRPEDDPERLRAELTRLEAIAQWDPGHPFLPLERLVRRVRLGDAAAGRAELARLKEAELAPYELALLADGLDEAGLPEQADAMFAATVEAQARRGLNPDLNPILIGNPALVLRKTSARAMGAGEVERALRLMDLNRQIATAVEADRAMLRLEARWLREHGRETRAAALEPYVARARVLGGSFLVPETLVQGFDLLVFLTGVIPVLLSAAAGVLWLRTRPARIADLRELGFRSWSARLLAFASHPALRLAHTFLAYATRGQRAAFVLGSALALLGFLYLVLVISTVARLAEIPVVLGANQLGHPKAEEYVRAEMDRVDPSQRAPHLRLLAEGALACGRVDEAQEHLDRLLVLVPDDAFGRANRGLLWERDGRRDEALREYEYAAAHAGEAGAVGRFNRARLRGEELPPLPVQYAGLLRVRPPEAPLRQLAGPADLHAVLRLRVSPLELFWKHLSSLGRGSRELMLIFGAGGSTALFADAPPIFRLFDLLDSGILGVLALVGLAALLHLPFPPRRSEPGPTPRARTWLGRGGELGNLLLPGTAVLTQGRVVLGLLVMPLAPLCGLLNYLGREGGIVMAAAIPQLPSPFGTVTVQDVLVTPGAAMLGGTAGVVFVLLYLASWGRGCWRALSWWRARGNAA